MSLLDRFLKYVTVDTTSDPESQKSPSVPEKELPFADMLAEELQSLGADNVRRDEYGYVYATIPSTIENYTGKIVGFIAHMDTASDAPGAHIRPRVIPRYPGGDIELGNGVVLTKENSPFLVSQTGKTLVVTDGSTLLGGDDKAGVAAIVTAAEYLMSHPQIKHGPVKIAFTPDEEVGRGVEHFDIPLFGAKYAYTMDGQCLGGLEYENFNAAGASIDIRGVSIHPGSAKGRMVSALRVGMELESMLPVSEKPEYTEGREGFYHLLAVQGSVDHARMVYIIRDHDRDKFEQKKAFLQKVCDFLNDKYGKGTITAAIQDSYYNMKQAVEPYPFMLDYVREVYRSMGIASKEEPIRGGTDGATLSLRGLPCPNLGTGAYNCHGRTEYAVVEEMEKASEVIVRLAQRYAQD